MMDKPPIRQVDSSSENATVKHIPKSDLIYATPHEPNHSGYEENLGDSVAAAFHYLFENNPNPMWIYEVETLAFLMVNDAALIHYGYSRDEFLNLTIKDIRPSDDLPALLDNLAQPSLSLEQSGSWRHCKKDGSLIDVEITSHAVQLGGKAARLVTIHDVTERKQTEESLHKSKALLTEAQRLGKIGHWEWQAPGKDLICSDELLRILELPQSNNMISMDLFDAMLIGNDRERLKNLDKMAFADQSDLDYEFCIQLADGELRWLHQQAQVFYDAAGEPYRIMAIIQDITERRRTEVALRESEEKYRVLVGSLDSIVATVDVDGHVLYMNEVAAQQLNGSPDQLTGKTFHELFPARTASYYLKRVQQVLHEGKKLVFEEKGFVRGQWRWFKTIVQPIHNTNYVLIHSIDIDDLKMAHQTLEELNHTLEERVRERTAQVQDLYDNAPNGYHSLDESGRIIMINHTALNWLGYSRDELLGRPFTDLLPIADQEAFTIRFAQFKPYGTENSTELELIRKDGSLLPVLMNTVAVYDTKGQFLQSRFTIFDVTARRKTERALRESRDELRRANTALAKAARLKDEFLANMSHELRTPLNSILIFSESLLEQVSGPLTERQQQWVQNIEASGRHLLSLINDILDLSKVEAGQITLQMETVSVAQICQASLLFVKEMATKKQLALTYQLNDHQAQVEVDPKRLKQILVNLLSNAIKFTPTGGKVGLNVAVDQAAGVIRYMVEDTGIGIAAADIPRLFQPFTQLDSSLNRHHEGTGLGLVLVQRLTTLHNGDITVHSEAGQGSRFTITMPYQAPIRTVKGVGYLPPQPDLPHSPLTPLETRILLAEDNEFNIVAFTDYLNAKGYQVTIAHNGREALALAKEMHPHLILMDIQMPEMDGLEAMRQLRTLSEFAQTPIIALTALAMPGDRDRCLTAGANDYLAKPVSLKELIERIQALLL